MTEIQMDFTEMFPSTKWEGIENVIEWLGRGLQGTEQYKIPPKL